MLSGQFQLITSLKYKGAAMNNKPSFLDAVTSITIRSSIYFDSEVYNFEYLLDHKADVWVLATAYKMIISAPVGSVGYATFDNGKVRRSGNNHNGVISIQFGHEDIDARLADCVLSSDTLSSPLKTFFLGENLDREILYKFDGVDHGAHVLQPKYSQFYSIDGYFTDEELRGKYFDFDSVKEVLYPPNAPYDVDIVTNGKLIDNTNGVSSAEGVDALGGGSTHIRIRYKDVNKPYFGPLDVKLVYGSGAFLTPPMEVVKSV